MEEPQWRAVKAGQLDRCSSSFCGSATQTSTVRSSRNSSAFATDMVRVIDSLVVYKDPDGELEVEHLSNLSEQEAIELGSKIGALIGLGFEGEEGAEAGAAAGAEEAAAEGIKRARRAGGLGRSRRHPERLRGGADPAGTPLGGPRVRRSGPGSPR